MRGERRRLMSAFLDGFLLTMAYLVPCLILMRVLRIG
jgi:hypothetical protein